MKRIFIWIMLFVLICQAAISAIAYGQGLVDDEGFPYPSDEPDPMPPAEPPDAEAATAEASANSLIPVDPRLWSVESYPPVAGFPGAYWHRTSSWAGEYENAQPTLLYSNFPALWTALEAQLLATYYYDDDYIGFTVGFQPADTSSASADYLLVDWKRRTQWFDFGAPSYTPGSTAWCGLAVSRVFGVPTADEFWGHVNFDHECSDLSNGLEEQARANTLGNTGWTLSKWIHCRLEYTPTSLKVYVNGQPEIDLTGNFGQGRWAFYNFSQLATYYANPKVESLPVPAAIDIKPGSYPNAVNIDGHGVIPVAILGSADFDVTWIATGSLQFGGMEVKVKGNGSPQCSIDDVSGPDGVPDGWDDLVCQFADDPELWLPGDGVATLTGTLLAEFGGVSFEASDEITIVP